VFRLILGVIAGYGLFALTAVLIFAVAGRDPHAPADPVFLVGSIGAGTIAAIGGGYFGAVVARGRERTAGGVLALIIAGAALVSLLMAEPEQGERWSALAALVLMSPMAFVGAVVRIRRTSQPSR
jgi:hypothetical protein